MAQVDDSEVRPRLRRLLVVVVLISALVGGGLLAIHVWGEVTYCSGAPSQQEQARQQAFVLAHISDARGFEWEIADCDDQGVAVLNYTTALDPATATAILQADPACSPPTKPNVDPETLLCQSGGLQVEVGFEQDTDRQTNGYLAWLDRGVDL